jgi:RNA polymerase sigma factor (sigma-70 family)
MREPKSDSAIEERDILNMFLRDVRKVPLLEREEELSLIRKARAGDLEAERKLVESNLRFVVKVTLAYWRAVAHRYPGLSVMDCLSEACISLMKAVKRLDPAFGCRVLTYAAPGIIRGITRTIVIYRRHMCKSLDDPIFTDSEETVLDTLISQEQSADATAFQNELFSLLQKLRSRERTVLEERYRNDKTLAEVGELLNVSAERVRNI